MIAVKGNKAYTVDEKSKTRYINDGFDIVGDEGEVLETGRGKTVSYEEHQKVVAELEELKASMLETANESVDETTKEAAKETEESNKEATNETEESKTAKSNKK